MRAPLASAILLLSALILLAACRSGGGSEERSPGELTFRRNCQTCHRLPKPSLKTDEEWPRFVQRYGQRARLTQEQIDLVLGYLTANN